MQDVMLPNAVLVSFILYFKLEINVLFKQIYVITFRSKRLGYAAYFRSMRKKNQRDKRSNITLLFTYTTCFGRNFRPTPGDTIPI